MTQDLPKRVVALISLALLCGCAWSPPFGRPGVTEPAQLDKDLQAILDYRMGQGRQALTELSERIRTCDSSERRMLLHQLAGLTMMPEASGQAKDFACRQLAIHGGDEVVPVLAELLLDPQTADMGRYALERIPGERVDRALRGALGRAPAACKIGIIHTLGQRRDAEAVDWMVAPAKSADPDLARAALAALGHIATPRAAETLQRLESSISPELAVSLAESRLLCAERMAAEHDGDQAVRIYRDLYTPARPAIIRIAALRGLVSAQPQQAAQWVIAGLDSDQSRMRDNALQLIQAMPGHQTTRAFAEQLEHVDRHTRLMLIGALAARGDPAALPNILEFVQSDHVSVRTAAIGSVAALGDAGNVPMLVGLLAARGDPEAQAARHSLERMRDPHVNQALVEAADTADPSVQSQVAAILQRRRAVDQAPVLLQWATEGDSRLRLACLRGLGVLAGPEHLDRLLELLIQSKTEAEREAATQALVQLCRSLEDAEPSLHQLLAALDRNPPTAVRVAMLRVLGACGGDRALRRIRSALQAQQPLPVRIAAVKALSQWTDARPAPALLELARSAEHEKLRILALRGFIELTKSGLERRPVQRSVDMLEQAWQLARQPGQQRMVLSVLGRVPHPRAFEIARNAIAHGAVADEAAVATIESGHRLYGTCPERVREGMLEVINRVPAMRDRAEALVDRIDDLASYVTTWKVAGPFRVEGKSHEEMLTLAMGPETSLQSISWKAAQAGDDEDEDRPWLIDLQNNLGDHEECVAYLITKLWSSRDRQARLDLGSDDGVRVWLNGRVVHINATHRGVDRGDDQIQVELRKGWSLLALKVSQDGGSWGACLAIRDREGHPLQDVRASIEDLPGAGAFFAP